MATLASQIRGLDHIALELSDLAQGERFFGNVLGCKERFRATFEGRELVMLTAGSIEIEMWQRQNMTAVPDQESPTTVHHLALSVKSLDRAMAAVRSLSVPVLVEPYEPTRGIREAIIQGPDGLRVQLAEKNIPLLIWRSLRGDLGR